jgi:Tfp pilus assembly protein PilO
MSRLRENLGPLAATAAVVLLALAGYFVVLAPVRGDAASASAEIEQARQALAAKLSRPAEPVRRVTVAGLFPLTKALPDRIDMPGVLLDLSEVARATGVDFQSIAPAAGTPAQNYYSLPLDVVFEGNFFELSDFLYRLRNLAELRDGTVVATGRLFSVESIELKANPATFPRLQATLTIDAFVRGAAPGAEAAAEAAPTATAATATTETSAPAPSGGQP